MLLSEATRAIQVTHYGSELSQLRFPLFLIALHDRLVIHVEQRVFLIAAQLESGNLGLIGELGDFGVSAEHGDSFVGHGFHAPVARHGHDEQQKQYDSKPEGETFCNRRLRSTYVVFLSQSISDRAEALNSLWLLNINF